MHLDAERLQRLLDRELEPEAETAIRGHLDTCGPCRAEVAGAEREVAEVHRLLGMLDVAAPPLEPADMIRAKAGRIGWGRRAALVCLGVGLAAVAYATPGSPLPDWLRTIAARLQPAPNRPVPLPAAAESTQIADASGVAVNPGERLTVILPSPRAGALAYVSLSDSTDLAIQVVSGRASFSSGIDRLMVETPDSSAIFRIRVPRAAPRIEIRAGSERLLLQQEGRITTPADPGAGGVYLFRVPPRGP